MEDNNLILDQKEAPDLDAEEYGAFRVGFMKSILLSLLAQNKINQAQYDCCMEKILKKHTDASAL